eukprot:scaffold279735_cov37-Tisochrysis_lutea.AAC.2
MVLEDEWALGEATLDKRKERFARGAKQVGNGNRCRPIGPSKAVDEHPTSRPLAVKLLTYE